MNYSLLRLSRRFQRFAFVYLKEGVKTAAPPLHRVPGESVEDGLVGEGKGAHRGADEVQRCVQVGHLRVALPHRPRLRARKNTQEPNEEALKSHVGRIGSPSETKQYIK